MPTIAWIAIGALVATLAVIGLFVAMSAQRDLEAPSIFPGITPEEGKKKHG